MKRILVVEDDPVTRRLLEKLLQGASYEVKLAEDGVEGLEALRAEAFDLMLTDVWMPRMGGLELLAAMRAEQRGPRAIVMTSDGTPETVLRAVREQAYQYVNKPMDASRLLELVEGALASGRAAGTVEVISGQPNWVELLIPCDLGMANRIQEIMSKLDADLPESVREDVGYVFSEMLRNAVEWGGRLDPNRKVRVACVRTKRMVLYRIADPGPGFKMEDLSHAAVHYEAENVAESARVRQEKGLRAGGFGILVSRSMVDELVYNEKHNEVMFVKYLEASPTES
jgi:CheY-like chemotaxis protein/anti-sigma regulatory factor (Ser/Thr protein kinase)